MELTLQQILAATQGRLLQGRPEQPVTAVIIDSRSAGPGSLFVPLVGSRADGHDYIAAGSRSRRRLFCQKRACGLRGACGSCHRPLRL